MARRSGIFVLWIALLLSAVAGGGGEAGAAPQPQRAAAPPQRIVSLNLCADQLVVLLVEPSRIAALSKLSRDRSLSYVARQAEAFPQAQPGAESVLGFNPDLVVSGRHTAIQTTNFLKARGVPVLQLNLLSSFAAIREQTRSVGKALGAEARAEQLLAAMDAILADEGPPPPSPRPVALVWQPGGFTSGAGTLVEAVLNAAGFDNLASRRGVKGYGYLTLESVVVGRPDLLISDPNMPEQPSLRQALLSHPALRAGPGGIGARFVSPPPLTACAGPFTAEAVALLRQKRRELTP